MKQIFLAALLAISGFSLNSLAHEGEHHHEGQHQDGPANPAPVLAGHLAYKGNTLHLHAYFNPAPKVGGESFLRLEARSAATHQIIELKDRVQVTLWMPSMNHGSAPTQVEQVLNSDGELQPGVFNVRNLYFIMPGDWEVRVTLTDSQGHVETQKFSLKL
jgi:hypothetical protein